jgi:DNA-binding beta-propeller fold protein YncE
LKRARWLVAAVLLAGCYDLDGLPRLYAGDGGTGDGSTDGGPAAHTLSLVAGAIGGHGAAEGIGPDARLDAPTGLCKSGSDVYIVDSNSATVWKLKDGGSTLVAGRPYQPGFADGAAEVARFSSPRNCVVVGDDLFLTDWGNSIVRHLQLSTGMVLTLAGVPAMYGVADGPPPTGRLGYPNGITYLGSALYVADQGNHAIVRIDPATGTITTIAGNFNPGYVDNTDGASARFNAPIGLTSDGNSTLYVTDQNNRVVRRISTMAPYPVALVAGVPGMSASMNGLALQAQFIAPISVDLRAGFLYVGDDSTVRTIDLAAGQVATLAGSPVHGPDDGPIGTAHFGAALGVLALDGGDLLVADNDNGLVRRISGGTSGIVSTELGLYRRAGLVDAAGGQARFISPQQLLPVAGAVLVADSGNHVLRQLDASGEVTTVAGTGAEGHADGAARTLATFGAPVGLALGDDGTIYVSDTFFHDIRAFHDGSVTTVAGDPSGKAGFANGVGAGASFNSPVGLAVVGTTLYVADSFNDAVRRIDLPTGTVSTFVDGTKALTPSCSGSGLRPWGLIADPARGRLYVSAASSCSVAVIALDSGKVTPLTGGRRGTADGGPMEAQFDAPSTMAFDGNQLVVADRIAGLLRTVDVTSGQTGTLLGVPERHGVRLAPAAPRLNLPEGLAYFGGALLVVAPSENAVLQLR